MRYTFECQKCGLTGESAEPVGSPCGEEVTTDDGREVECDGQIICLDENGEVVKP